MDKTEADDFKHRLERLERKMFGNGELGVAQQNSIMWRVHVWVLCALSAGLGIAATVVIQRLMKAL